MNRKARRAALSRGKAAGQPLPGETTRPRQIMAQALHLYRNANSRRPSKPAATSSRASQLTAAVIICLD